MERKRVGTVQFFVTVDKEVLCECMSQAKQSVFTLSLFTMLAVLYQFHFQFGETKKKKPVQYLEEPVCVVAPKWKNYILKQIETLFKNFSK